MNTYGFVSAGGEGHSLTFQIQDSHNSTILTAPEEHSPVQHPELQENIVHLVQVTLLAWLPYPYMVNAFKISLLQPTNGLETWYISFGTEVL